MAEKRDSLKESGKEVRTKSSSKLIKDYKTQKNIENIEKGSEKCPTKNSDKNKSEDKTGKSSSEAGTMKKNGSNWLQVASITLNLFLIVSTR